ncbi:MAG: helix-turn-helix domain-containing protein [Ruminococcaceae bacterium]|nr:helix-turn-helix domain-containing protein [Oscillospiraceae bacterium]
MQERRERPLWRKKSELLRNRPVCVDELCFSEPLPELPFEGLYSNEILEVAVVTEGSGVVQIFGQAIPCKKSDVFIIPPDIPHGYYPSEGAERLCISRLLFDVKDWFEGEPALFGHPRFCYGVFRDRSLVAYAMLTANVLGEVLELFSAIERESVGRQEEWKDALRARLTVLFVKLGRYIGDALLDIKETGHGDWTYAAYSVRIIMESFGDAELTLESVAEALHVSKAHLSRLFKEFAGESFSKHLRDIRLNNACRLLRETELTVEEIVSLCGLKDVPSFYRNFQNHTGTTPSQYRAEKINQRTKGEKIMVVLSDISEKLQQGRGKIVVQLIEEALNEGCDPEKILNEGLLAGMDVIGEKFRNNEIFVPEVLIAARAMNMGAQILKPHLVASGVAVAGKVCIGTVQGDLHDIGKNLVKMMMEGKGLEVIDLGTDVPAERFVQTAIEENCQVICCSALLTTTMHVMDEVVKAAEAAGIRDKVKIMIGGAPVSDDFCKQIGADIYTSDAASAANAAVDFCKNKQ